MPTAALSGHTGTVTGAGTTAEVTKWDAKVSVKLLDATSFDSAGWKEFITGLQGCSGSIAMQTAPPAAGASVSLALGVGDIAISGTALIGKTGNMVEVAGKVNYTVEFKFTGAVSVAVAA